ncbi:MAG: hypothetical protein ACT4P7_20585 [Gemmatimonadaceae bacterium]
MHTFLEQIPTTEAADIQAVIDDSLALLDTTSHPVRRGQHPKTTAIVTATFTVRGDLPPDLRLGVFREPHTYEALVRFSNGAQQNDRTRDVHGMATKLLGVDGPRVMDWEPPTTTHDFVMVDSPAFFIRNAADYAGFSNAVVAATRRARRIPFLPSAIRNLLVVLTLVLGYFRKHRYEFAALRRMRRTPRSPLATTYYSNTVYRLGDRAVRYAMRPVDATARAAPRSGRSRDWFRQAVTQQLLEGDATFEFLVQLQSDPARQPAEDPTIAWDDDTLPWSERASRYVHVGTLQLPSQQVDRALDESFGEALSFNPWNARPEHAPIGGINRTRRAVYELLSRQRHELNGQPMGEPQRVARHTPAGVPRVR